MAGELLYDILEKCGKKSRYAEVRYMEMESSGASFRNGSFEGARSLSSGGYAIRVLNNSLSMAYVNSEDSAESFSSTLSVFSVSRSRQKNFTKAV